MCERIAEQSKPVTFAVSRESVLLTTTTSEVVNWTVLSRRILF